MYELCVCAHVLVVCDDGGCVGGDVGCAVTFVAEGVLVVPAPSASPLFSTFLWEGSLPWTGVVGHGTVFQGPTQRR